MADETVTVPIPKKKQPVVDNRITLTQTVDTLTGLFIAFIVVLFLRECGKFGVDSLFDHNQEPIFWCLTWLPSVLFMPFLVRAVRLPGWVRSKFKIGKNPKNIL